MPIEAFLDYGVKAAGIVVAEWRFIALSGLLLCLALRLNRSGKTRLAAVVTAILAVQFLYAESIFFWATSLGPDSFSEIDHHASGNEIAFWLKTFSTIITVKAVDLKRFVLHASLLVLIAAVFLFIEIRLRKLRGQTTAMLLTLIALWHVDAAVGLVIAFHDNTYDLKNLQQQYLNNITVDSAGLRKDLRVVIYVGESTSAMHFQLYGYPRKTTPELVELARTDEGLLRFDNVYSTHTHTTPSLLRAFSIPTGVTDEKIGGPEKRKFASLLGSLKTAKVDLFLASNQGKTGSWNRGSQIVFSAVENQRFSSGGELGNVHISEAIPFDWDFFSGIDINQKPGIVVLHSYAGHGDYLDNVPKAFRGVVDNRLEKITSVGVLGDVIGFKRADKVNVIEQYDSAMTYVDYSVSNAIKLVSSDPKPRVFIYFADHGESVLAGRGHDSSRFIEEMARVPFIIYFNRSARSKYPELYSRYHELASSSRQNLSTLAQLPSTLLDILNVRPMVPVPPSVGAPHDADIEPILVRETAAGITKVDLNHRAMLVAQTDDSRRAGTTMPTAANVAWKSGPVSEQIICYHRSNTYAKAIRGAFVAPCIEFDLVVEDDGRMMVYHPPAEATGLRIADMFALAKAKGTGLWIDAKNLSSPRNCQRLLTAIQASHVPSRQLFVEFPPDTDLINAQLAECAKSMKSTEVRTSYYLPTGELGSCAAHLRKVRSAAGSEDCKLVHKLIGQAVDSKVFTDISFDVVGLPAVEASKEATSLRWNTRALKPSELDALPKGRFGNVILDTSSDPNRQ